MVVKTASEVHPNTWQWVAWDDLRGMKSSTLEQAIARVLMCNAIGRSDFVGYLKAFGFYHDLSVKINERG